MPIDKTDQVSQTISVTFNDSVYPKETAELIRMLEI